MKKTPERKALTGGKKKKNVPVLKTEVFLHEIGAIRNDLSELRKEMNAHFERHQNIILAEYRHRIETLERKVSSMEEHSSKK